MTTSIIAGQPQQSPAAAFRPNQAPPSANDIRQTNGPALKPEKIVNIDQQPVLSRNQIQDGPSEISKSISRGSTVDFSA